MRSVLRWFVGLSFSVLCACAGAPPRHSHDLFATAESGDMPELNRMLAAGADINARDDEGKSPLYFAAKAGHAEAAEALIARGAEVDARMKGGYTPLFAAAAEGHLRATRVLLDHGANVNARDANGVSPLFFTLNRMTSVYLLTASSPAALARQRAMGPAMVQKRLDELGGTTRHRHEVAMLLIEHGAEVNVPAVRGDTLLYMAAAAGDKDVVAALIKKGANIEGSNAAGETPLHTAVAERHADVAELLVENGANEHALNRSDRTPLHFLAAYLDDAKLAELMIEHGADVNARDRRGATPLTFATRAGNHHVAEVLRRHGAT
jgi:ankyrin repeat protein